jgi:spermidine synthase
VTRAARIRLSAVVLVAGAASLATEMAGARLLAPYFGASNLVWANVIGLTLIYLSAGYWLGGRLADRHPSERALGLVMLGAALALALVPFLTRPLFSAAASAFADVSAGAFVASFFGAMAMFAVPVTALGMVAPWAVRLSVREVSEAGTVAGRLYALSTLGSIVGTFLPVLVLIPAIGTRRTLLATAALLALAAAPALAPRLRAAPLALIGLALVPLGPVKPGGEDRVLFEGESAYQFVEVVREPDGDTALHLNEGFAVHSLLPGRGVLTGGYWDAFLALPLLTGRPAGRLAVLGNAGGTVANLYERAWPRAPIDGVEIDGLVSDVGRRYLGMRNPRLRVHTADARFWLAGERGRFDAIVVDAYRQPYIPFHLVTREFFTLVRDRLAPDGVVAINVGTPPRLTEAATRIARTMRAVFPAVQATRYDRFNSIVIGYRSAARAASAGRLLRRAEGLAAPAALRLAATLRPVPPSADPLTDDRAPIEALTDRALLEYIREGAPGV